MTGYPKRGAMQFMAELQRNGTFWRNTIILIGLVVFCGSLMFVQLAAFPGHEGRMWPLARWRSLTRIIDTVHQ